MKKYLYIIALLVLPYCTYAADYYVSESGSGSTCSEGTPCALSYANTNASAGDNVYLMDDDGNFTSQINPSNSGSDGSPITYQAYTGDTPIVTYSGNYQAYINGRSYIVLDGIAFSGGSNHQVRLYGTTTFNEIKNCEFSGSDYTSVYLGSSSDNNYIHDNVFNATSEATDEATESDVVFIAGDSNRIIDNTFYDGGGHAFIWVTYFADYNVIRGNIGTITDYWDSATSPDNAGLDLFVGAERSATYILVEDNTWIQDANATEPRGVPTQLNRVTNFIYRKNQHWNNRGYTALYTNNTGLDNEDNRFYNNSYYASRDDFFYSENPGLVTLSENNSGGPKCHDNKFTNNIYQHYVYNGFRKLGESSEIYDNLINNNILYDVDSYDVNRFGSTMDLATAESSYPSEYSGNIDDNPDFVNPGSKDLSLQSDSPAIDTGEWLATITSVTGSGTTFVVDDPNYFYDGWSIPGETGDLIETENGETTTIQSINYSTGQITVNPAIDYVNGEGVALDYEGSAPDIGAEEYQQTGVIMTITATDSSGAEEGTDPVEFTLACSPDCNATAVNYSFSGGAVLDTDYNCDDEDGTITITGSSDTITCTPVDDSEQEITETVTVTIGSGSGYSVGSPSQANGIITDNDGAQDQFIGGITVDGSGSGQITYDQSGTGQWTR